MHRIESSWLRRLAICGALSVAGSTAQAASTQTFDTDPTLGSTQAPDTWYTDRYAPDAFESTSFDGDNRLRHGIAEEDGANSRPGSFGSAFYNTQGRKYDTPGATFLAVDLYVPEQWQTTGRRMAGLWGVGFDASNSIAQYPIVEFASDGSNGYFQVWDGSAFNTLGLPTGFAYDSWQTLSILLDGGDFIAGVGDATLELSANGSVSMEQAILQGHNTTDGVSYDIYWDNFTAGATGTVPLPGTLGLLLLGGLALTGMRRRV